MSKELKNFGEDVMNNIREGKVKMRPKYYFVLGSVLTFVGLVLSIFTSVLFVGLIRFSIRANGLMSGRRLDMMLNTFPWWAPVLAVLGLVVGIWLIRKYDFSYKIDFKIIIVGVVLAILVSGLLVDMIGFNDVLLRRGPAKDVMRKYFMQSSVEHTHEYFIKPQMTRNYPLRILRGRM